MCSSTNNNIWVVQVCSCQHVSLSEDKVKVFYAIKHILHKMFVPTLNTPMYKKIVMWCNYLQRCQRLSIMKPNSVQKAMEINLDTTITLTLEIFWNHEKVENMKIHIGHSAFIPTSTCFIMKMFRDTTYNAPWENFP